MEAKIYTHKDMERGKYWVTQNIKKGDHMKDWVEGEGDIATDFLAVGMMKKICAKGKEPIVLINPEDVDYWGFGDGEEE